MPRYASEHIWWLAIHAAIRVFDSDSSSDSKAWYVEPITMMDCGCSRVCILISACGRRQPLARAAVASSSQDSDSGLASFRARRLARRA